MMEVQAAHVMLAERPLDVSAIRSWWQQQQQAEWCPPAPIQRPRIRLKSSIKEVRLRKVDRSRREAEAAANGQLFLPRRMSHGAEGPSQAMAPWVASINDLDEHLLNKVLHAAAAPLRQGVGGAAVVVKQWTNLALVCRRWRQQMLVEPVAVAVGLDRWLAVRAWLSNTHVPLASLQLTAADGRAAQQLQQLLCSPHFQRVSGRHLAAAEMAFGFRFAALPGAWPCLQSLGDLIGLPRHPAALPPTLRKLSLWAPYSPHSQRPHPSLGPALQHLAELRCLWLGGWRVSYADLPPSLQLLKLQDCATVEDVAAWPPPLRRLVEAGVAPRGNTPADPFLAIGARPPPARQSHLLLCDPAAADKLLLAAFLRPPLREWQRWHERGR